jgi:hypothetical protein
MHNTSSYPLNLRTRAFGDGKGEKCVHDGFGRLREVRHVSMGSNNGNLKAAYRYNGIGFRTYSARNVNFETDNANGSGGPVKY